VFAALHALRSSFAMPLRPGDFPNWRLWVELELSVSLGMLSRMLKQWGTWIGPPSGGFSGIVLGILCQSGEVLLCQGQNCRDIYFDHD